MLDSAYLRRICLWLPIAIAASGLSGCARDGNEVTVPSVRSANFEYAYGRLREAGLRVRIDKRLTIGSLCSPTVASQEPAARTKLPRGAVVTLHAAPCFRGSPVVRDVSAVVPDFIGEVPSRAAEWAAEQGLFFELRLPQLAAGDAPTFLENFRVSSQEPEAGATLTPGIRVGGGFKPTPLVVAAETA